MPLSAHKVRPIKTTLGLVMVAAETARIANIVIPR